MNLMQHLLDNLEAYAALFYTTPDVESILAKVPSDHILYALKDRN